jgi:hypothetical protein
MTQKQGQHGEEDRLQMPTFAAEDQHNSKSTTKIVTVEKSTTESRDHGA